LKMHFVGLSFIIIWKCMVHPGCKISGHTHVCDRDRYTLPLQVAVICEKDRDTVWCCHGTVFSGCPVYRTGVEGNRGGN
jgi:hypothetical protein